MILDYAKAITYDLFLVLLRGILPLNASPHIVSGGTEEERLILIAL